MSCYGIAFRISMVIDVIVRKPDFVKAAKEPAVLPRNDLSSPSGRSWSSSSVEKAENSEIWLSL
jgi:hypothetical protein